MESQSLPSRNLWALTVLSLLRERPMHPYEMRRVIQQRHKDETLLLKRGSLYHVVEQLSRSGLIEVVETNRTGRRPERTVYGLTGQGEDTLLEWLRDLLLRPEREPSRLMAALTNIIQLPPQEVREQLTGRTVFLEAEIAGLDAVVRTVGGLIGRVAIVEVEYLRAMRRAELAWARSLIDDLGSGRFNWDREALQHMFAHAAADPATLARIRRLQGDGDGDEVTGSDGQADHRGGRHGDGTNHQAPSER